MSQPFWVLVGFGLNSSLFKVNSGHECTHGGIEKELVEHGLDECGQGAGIWTGMVSSQYVSNLVYICFFWRPPTTLTTFTICIRWRPPTICRTVLAGVRWVRTRTIRVDTHVALRLMQQAREDIYYIYIFMWFSSHIPFTTLLVDRAYLLVDRAFLSMSEHLHVMSWHVSKPS